jgi:hypothetical protein
MVQPIPIQHQPLTHHSTISSTAAHISYRNICDDRARKHIILKLNTYSSGNEEIFFSYSMHTDNCDNNLNIIHNRLRMRKEGTLPLHSTLNTISILRLRGGHHPSALVNCLGNEGHVVLLARHAAAHIVQSILRSLHSAIRGGEGSLAQVELVGAQNEHIRM